MSARIKMPFYDDAHSLLQVFRFEVNFGNNVLGFKRIDGLKLSNAYEPLEVGGMNDGPVMLRVPLKDAGRLTLERGKYYSGKRIRLSPGQALPEPMIIAVKDDFGRIGASYNVRRPVLESIELSGLDAADSAVLIEKLTVAHRGITEA